MHSEPIVSRRNPLIKQFRSLHSARERRQQGLFVVEGANAVEAALQGGVPIVQAMGSGRFPSLEKLLRARNIPFHEVDDEVLQFASDAATSVGIAAIAQLRPPNSVLPERGLIVVLDRVGDPGNTGTLIRAADAAGAACVITTEGACDPWSPKVVRAAAGSLFRVPVITPPERTPAAVAKWLSSESVPQVTADAHGGANCYSLPWPDRCALILGHETQGVDPAFQNAAALSATIPVYGGAESLNVAMAGTLLMYAWRQATAI